MFVELLEDRTLLTGSIGGTVVNDLNGNGVRDTGEPGVQAATAYLDLNHNGKYDPTDLFPGSTTIGDLGAALPALSGVQGVTAAVSGVSPLYTHITVTLAIARAASASGSFDVFLASPAGAAAGNGPELTPLPGGVSESVTFDDAAATSILQAPPPFVGTYQPAQALGDPANQVYNVNPDGTWFLLFLDHDGNPVSSAGVTITNWSITFTNPEPTTQTAANGSYSFTGLSPGSYTVGVTGTAAAHDPTRTTTVVNGQTTSGVDLAIHPAPGSIGGTVYNDLNGNGVRDTGEPGVQAATVYLDLNGDGKQDSARVPFPGSVVIGDLGAALPALSGVQGVTAAVSGVSPLYTHVTVTLAIARAASASGSFDVFLASPAGAAAGNGPELTPLPGGVSESVTFDDAAATSILQAPPPFVGTYQPAQPFSDPANQVYNVNPDGTWFLLFLDHDGNPVSSAGVTVTGWSITFTAPEPTTQTASDGSYSFTGLTPGSYTVGVSGTQAAYDPTRTVTVLTGQNTAGSDIGIHPAPGSIGGTVYNDLNSNGVRDTGEPGVQAATVYLDLNGDGKQDSARVPFPGSVVIGDLGAALPALSGVQGVTAAVSGVSPLYTHVTVTLAIARAASASGSFDVFLASPAGAAAGNGPELTPLPGGVSESVTFDDAAATSILQAPPPFVGTYQPAQALGDPANQVYNVNPDGTWFLLFLDHDGNPVSSAGVTVTGWSITFTAPEPTTQTASDGSYSFTGLAPGSYTVGVSGTQIAHDPSRTVTVLTGRNTTGTDIGISPTPGAISGTVTNSQTGHGLANATVYLDLNGNGRFDGTEPSTQTDANGKYTFAGLIPGTYTVGVAGVVAGADPTRSVAVITEQTATANFPLLPAPDLVATSFEVVGGFATFGQTVTVNYTIANHGPGDAVPFAVDLRLSPTNQIGASDAVLQSFTIDANGPVGLAAGAFTSGSLTVTLPDSVIAPPTGFTATGPIYLGLVVNPTDTPAERDIANNSNQGLDIDTALVSNAALTTGANAQQQPTIMVDPNNPNHIVVAYMNFNRPSSDPAITYAGIGVQTSTNGGLTWTSSALPLPAGFDGAAGYPSVAFDGQGHVSIAFMAATFSPGLLPPSIFSDGRDANNVLFRSYGLEANNGIFLSTSSDGGLTWNTPTAIVSHTYSGTPVLFETLPDLAIDRSATLPGGQANPNYGRLYLTWTRYYPAGQMPGVPSPTGSSDVMFAYSPNGGASWVLPTTNIASTTVKQSVTAGNSYSLPYLNRAPQGTMVVVLSPGNTVTSGGLTLSVLAADNKTVLATVTTASQPTGVAIAVTPNEQVYLQVSGATASDSGNFTLQVGYTVPALRDLEHPADGAQPVGGGSDVISHLTIDPNGEVYVALNRGGLFRVFGSTNGGAFFSTLGDPFGDNFATLAPNPLAGEDFRNFPVRQILADPTRPGTLYALEVVDGAFDPTNPAGTTPNAADGSRVVFARSTDGGQTWPVVFTIDDDNGGNPLDLSESLLNQVVTGQAMPTMAVDNDGNVSVIFYDTRHDPAGHDLDVFGVTSTDGGKTLSATYRVSSSSFDPNAGQFPEGSDDFDFGDGIGLAAVNGIDLAVWTDTRHGNQDIFFANYPVVPAAPAAPNDRFEPNDSAPTATNLGVVSVPRVFPQLALIPGDDDWFRLTAGSTGTLTVTVTGATGLFPQTVELLDAAGAPLHATVTSVSSAGQTVEQLTLHDQAGQAYLIHVTGLPSGAPGVTYSLAVQSLTDDLGTLVHATRSGTLTPDGETAYRAVAGVSGSMEVTLTAGNGAGSLVLQALSADGRSVVQTGQPAGPGTQSVSIAVTAGQVVIIAVVGSTASDQGNYSLEFSNLDQFETTQNATLFFPTSGGTPSALGVADLNGDGPLDLVTANPDITDSNNNIINSDSVNVLLNNGDGTFGASQGYDAGPGPTGSLPGPIDLVVGPLTGPGTTDVAVSNYQAGNVSVLLGNANGTLQPPRISNSTALPAAMASGNLNGDATPDLAVLELHPGADGVSDVAVLFGRGDGTYLPPTFFPTTFTSGAGQVLVGDFTGHGKGSGLEDLVALGFNQSDIDLFVNQGNGTFTLHVLHAPEDVAGALAADLNGDGKTDLVLGGTNTGNVYVLLGNGDGTFQPAQTYFANTDPARTAASVSGLALATITRAGQPNPSPDLVVTVLPRLGNGSPQVVLLPANGNGTFGTARQLAVGPFTGPIVAGNLANNGVDDVAAAVPGGVEVIYGKGPSINANTTRNLGTVVHWLSQTLTIVPGHSDARFTMTVPKEVVPGAGPEVIDFSALFQYLDGSGLGFEVTGPDGTQSGTRFEVVANAGDVLTLHVFGLPGGGYGAYTLDIDLRPQAVSVAAPSLLPGTSGPVSSLVIAFQGDRLDPTTAQDPRNYTLFHLSPDGQTAERFTPATINDALPVVYDAGANIDVATGLFNPTAVRQTVTLFFPGALPAGSYLLVLSRAIQSAAYSDAESGRLADVAGFGGHTVVSTGNPGVENGAVLYLNDLVPVASGSADFTAFSAGTGFLTDFHDELGAMLDSQVTSQGDSPGITPALLDQSQQIFTSGTGAGGSGPSFLVLFIDPAGLSLVDPQSKRTTFDLQTNQVTNTQPKTYTEVGGNIEVVVVADVAGVFRLSLSDVVATARGGALVIGPDGVQQFSLTDQMRAGVQDFTFDVPASLTVAALGSEAAAAAGSATPTGTFSLSGLATEIVQAVTTGPTTVEITQAPVNETGGNVTAGGESATTTTAATSGTGLSGGGGSGAAGQTLWDAFKDNLEPLQKVLADLGKRAAKQSSVVGKGWDVLQTLGVPALVVPLQRVGGQVFKAVLRGLGAGLLGPAVQPPPGDGAVLPPPGDGPEVTPVGQAPTLPPAETSGKGGVLWLAAALAGGLVPVWREASRRKRRDERRRPSV